MARNNGGRAFPAQPVFHTPHGSIGMTTNDGMTLRDYFAGQVAASLAGRADTKANNKEGVSELMSVIAELAYALSDALIAERNKEGK